MILSDVEIRSLLRHGLLVIQPEPGPGSYTTSAVDLTLGTEFFQWNRPADGMEMILDPGSPHHRYEELARRYQEPVPTVEGSGVVLKPGQFLLCTTAERVQLPITTRVAARVEGRSSLARYGVGIHVTAPTIHAGFRGRITLEVTHSGAYPVRLRPGMRICQLIFEMLSGIPSQEREGAFQDQESPQGSRVR